MINAPSRQELDALLRKVLTDVKTSLDNVAEIKAALDQVTDANLANPDLGWAYAPGDITNLRSSLEDMDLLRRIAMGQATQATQKDFFAIVKRIWGVNLIRR